MGLEKMKQAEAKNKPPQRSASPAPPLPLDRYAGTYQQSGVRPGHHNRGAGSHSPCS